MNVMPYDPFFNNGSGGDFDELLNPPPYLTRFDPRAEFTKVEDSLKSSEQSPVLVPGE